MGVFFNDWMLDLTTFLCIIVGLVYYYLRLTYSYWERRNVPYIKPEMFYGNMKEILTFKRSQPEVFADFYHEFKKSGHRFGGIYQLHAPVLLITDPLLLNDLLIKHFPVFHDRGMTYDENFDPLTAHLIFLDGAKWKFIRAKLMPSLSTGKLRSMFPVMQESVKLLVSLFERAANSGDVLDVREVTAQFTTDVIGSCAFGLNFNSLADGGSKFRDMGKKALEPTKMGKFLQIVRNVYPWAYKLFKLRTYDQEMTDFFVNLVKDTMQMRKDNNIVRKDFLHFLMKLKESKTVSLHNVEEMQGVENYNLAVDESAIEMTDGVITAQALIFFLAGFETSSTTLSFCLHELAFHPDLQDKLKEDVDAMVAKHGGMTYEAVTDMKYVGQVVDETLRKYPTGNILFRECLKPYKFPDSDFVLEPGKTIMIPIYAIHHDPEYYPDPKKFDPERFSDENKHKILPHTYLPFGEGPRICIGMRFALIEIKQALAALMAKYKVVPCEQTLREPVLDPRTFVLSAKDGINLRVVKRE